MKSCGQLLLHTKTLNGFPCWDERWLLMLFDEFSWYAAFVSHTGSAYIIISYVSHHQKSW